MAIDPVDIVENTLRRHDGLLEILLLDRTRTNNKKNHNILWATDSYSGFKPTDEIGILDITGPSTYLIQPRIAKPKEEQQHRTKDKAEVFTPKEIVDSMNKQIDWNDENFPVTTDNWQKYVRELKLEITCGEAPFIVGRYNAVNGKKVLKLEERVGFLDRKMQVVSKYCKSKEEWLKWAKKAYQSSYGYEWQGDNLILARENLLYTLKDYWNEQFPKDRINLDRTVSEEKMQILREFAYIISWNIFQMDGLKYVVPMSCKSVHVVDDTPPILKLLGEKKPKAKKTEICPGCANHDPTLHNGKYVKIMDWEKGKPTKFISLLK